MRVYKDTDLEFTFMPWELEPPKTTLIVVVKATFDLIHEGPCTLAEEQVPCLGEVPWDDGDSPSLRTETDYAILKPKAEWYLTGSAHAVGSPATLVPVRVRIAEMEKRLTVWGDRVWSRGLMGAKPSDPVPFQSMPLRWERAFGGPDVAANPVGRGMAPMDTGDGTVDPLPNIEADGQPIVSKDARPAPAGMFAIPCTWEARLRHTGTYDEIWKVSRWPYFPKDFEWSFFNCAPPDQRRTEYWRGDEAIELTGLHPELAHLRTRLPSLRARFFVEWVRPSFQGDKTALFERPELEAYGLPKLEDVPLRLDTIVIDSDLGQVMCQWRGFIEVANPQLTDVMRFFVVHEPLEASEPMSHYERWLQRKLLDEADEFAIEMPEGEEAGVGASAGAGGGDGAPDVAELVARNDRQWALALGAFGEWAFPQPPLPDVQSVREAYREAGLDPDELLPQTDPAHTPDLPDAPSLLRLAAIIRRRLGKPFTNLDLTGAPYQNLDLSGVDFSGSLLTDANLSRANLSKCVLDGATLVRANLYGVDFFEASLVGADLSEVKAKDARFSRAMLNDLTATDADFERAIFHQASLEGADLVGCNLYRCDLRETKLDSADLTDSNIEEANFSASSMVDTALEGVRAREAVFERCRMPDFRGSDGADFSGARFTLVDAPRAQLQGATLIGASFAGSNLEEADLSESRAEGVNFLRCVLRGAKLDRADLTRAQLMQADLFEASLEGTILSGADLRGAHLFSAHLWRAHTDGALFDGAILDRTVLGPS